MDLRVTIAGIIHRDPLDADVLHGEMTHDLGTVQKTNNELPSQQRLKDQEDGGGTTRTTFLSGAPSAEHPDPMQHPNTGNKLHGLRAHTGHPPDGTSWPTAILQGPTLVPPTHGGCKRVSSQPQSLAPMSPFEDNP